MDCKNDSNAHRSAFTLLETLLALGLSGFMLMVVFSLVDSTVTYHIDGNSQVLSSQRMLGVLQDLRYDLRSAYANPNWSRPASADLASGDLASGDPSSIPEKFAQQLQLPELATTAEPIAFIGQSTWFLLTLSQSSPRFPASADQQNLPNQQVLWTMGSAGAIVIPTHDDQGRRLSTRVSDLSPSSLWRCEINASPASFFAPARHESCRIVDAQSLQLRYFNGRSWQSTWDSVAEKALPRAVEITLHTHSLEPLRWVVAMSAESRSIASHKEVR